MAYTGSEYELRELGFKFEGTEAYTSVPCVGSCEEEMNVKVVTKSCRGVVKKKKIRPDGTGVLKITAHIPYEVYVQAYGMELDTLIEGVKAYGQNSRHKGMSIVADTYDEDDNRKFKAYPNCVIETGVVRKIENGGEEVAQLELEIAVSPDDYGNGLYEALEADLQDETAKTKWMTEFKPAMVQKQPTA